MVNCTLRDIVGRVDMNPFDVIGAIKSIYTRLISANPSTAKVYYFDTTS